MIKIEIRKAKNLMEEKSGFISFSYDNKIVNIMRNQPQRYWHKKEKEWEIPFTKLTRLIPELNKWKIEITGYYKQTEKKIFKTPKGFEFKTKPFQHQKEGFKYGLNHNRFLLGDEQGLGKTKQVIDIALAKKISHNYKHCLIICGVNGLKYNWQSEIEIHSNEKGYILGTRYNKNGGSRIPSNKEKLEDLKTLPDNYFLITNIESFRNKEIVEEVKKLVDKGIIEMVAIDEIHKAKNPSSQQGKGILKVQAKTRIAVTGTPLMNNPLDLYIILKWLGYEHHSFYQFKNYYCVMGGYGGYEIVGYRNLSQLQENLDSIMIRRLKREVLDLPDKLHTTEYVEMSKDQNKIYNEVMMDIKRNIDKIKISNNPLAQLIRLRQATGYTGILSNQIQESAKLDRLEELVEEIVANDDKVIIFSNWTSMTGPTFERLKRFNPALITGEIKEGEREIQKDKFMTNPDCKVIIGTTGAMGTGITLTAGSTVIFLDSPWNRALKEQAEDRAHRIGTTSNVNVITLVCKNTIDERIEDLVMQKGKMSDALVDGKIQFNRDAVIDFLLN